MEDLRNQIIDALRKLELALNSTKFQALIEAEQDLKVRKALLRERTDVVVARVKLENIVLERISARLKQLEPDLKAGIKDLENEIKKISDALDILSIVDRVTGLVAKIFLIL